MNFFGLIKGREYWFIGPIFTLAIIQDFGVKIFEENNVKDQSILYYVIVVAILLGLTLSIIVISKKVVEAIVGLHFYLIKQSDDQNRERTKKYLDDTMNIVTLIFIFLGIAGIFKLGIPELKNEFIPLKNCSIFWNIGLLLMGLSLITGKEETSKEKEKV